MSEDMSINEASSNRSRNGSIVPSPTKQESKPEPDSDPMEASTSTGGSTSDGSGGASKIKKKKKLRIKILEKKLKILDKHIKKCNETELSLEEMDSGASVYMKEDLYKRKFVATWQELCELVQVPDSIEVKELSHTTSYSKTPFPEINRRVERLIKLDQFPDHFDIMELIERCNQKHNLGISIEEKSTLSRQIFKEVGSILKERRQLDFVSHFGSHLTDEVRLEQDPALANEALLVQLKESLRTARERMEQVCEEYVSKQEQEVGKSLDEEKSTENTSDEDSEEDGDQGETVSVDQELDIDEVDKCIDEENASSSATDAASDIEFPATEIESDHNSVATTTHDDRSSPATEAECDHDDNESLMSEVASNHEKSKSPSTEETSNNEAQATGIHLDTSPATAKARIHDNSDNNSPTTSVEPPAKRIKLDIVDTDFTKDTVVTQQSSEKHFASDSTRGHSSDKGNPPLSTTPTTTPDVICIDSDDDDDDNDVICID